MPCVALRACVASFAVLASPPPPPGSKLQRVLITRALIVQDAGAVNYVHVWDGWVEAPSLAGPWTSASGAQVTVGNAYTGKSETVSAGKVTGPGGQSTEVAHAGNETYADHDGNVYRYDSQSGSFQQHDSGGGWGGGGFRGGGRR